ncbi:hypothetical protein [Nocardiopsis sp. YSL2]|uniref:hypothetical protein n=1 Tax=Nocardiopsis sp. YSL2 TaxID=2939492 RepID=UPI0026F46830|nr:hypothetical protein [Nocardiopsis sp. YSL2]
MPEPTSGGPDACQTDPRDLAAAIAEALYIEPSTDSETARQHALMQARPPGAQP